MKGQMSQDASTNRTAVRAALTLLSLLLLGTLLWAGHGAESQGAMSSFIVQAESTTAAVRHVEAVGGQVTRALALIDGVAAQLTPSQAERLAARPGARLTADRTVHMGSAPPAASARDRFDQDSFGNDDGNLHWSGPWQEIGEADGAPLGDVRVFAGALVLRDTGRGVQRVLDLTEATSAVLSFEARRKSFDDADDFYAFEVSTDGGARWIEAARLTGPANDDDFLSYDVDLSAFAGSVVRLRIISSATIDRRESLTLDEVALDVAFAENAPLTGSTANLVYAQQVDADLLHQQGQLGAGVTVAILDTGFWLHPALYRAPDGQPRVVAQYDAIADTLLTPAHLSTDGSGHGAHLASIIANSDAPLGGYAGVAPAVSLFPVKAFDENGMGSYADVIAGLEAIVAYRDVYNIRVANLSFSAPPESFYWDDPLNQAVMAAWQAGIVVVAAAGNAGPEPMTIGVPGNVPYVITVGAMSDNYTPYNESDDVLASFSSAGPTVEGFVKPELVAPGGHIAGLVSPYALLSLSYPEYRLAGNYFMMSGTSQATAVVSGVAALMLSQEPGLTPDDVKCRLLASAHPAVDDEGALAYSLFQQGAGLVNAQDASASAETGCANQGMDIALDLAGIVHYGGPANLDENGDYIVSDGDGNLLDGFAWSGGYVSNLFDQWDGDYEWLDGFAWSGGIIYSDNYIWSTGDFWDDNYTWSNAVMTVEGWVPQE